MGIQPISQPRRKGRCIHQWITRIRYDPDKGGQNLITEAVCAFCDTSRTWHFKHTASSK